jgi:hypothetical protein
MDIAAHIADVGKMARKLSAACDAAVTGLSPSAAAHTCVAAPSRRARTDVFRLTEVCPNMYLCNGFLGGGSGQARRLFVDLLRRERIGLVATACHWTSARTVAATASEADARHVLLDHTQETLVRWKNLRDAFEDILQTMQTQRVLINCFEYAPVGAMVAVALMVYSNMPIGRAVEAVLPFEPSIKAVAQAKRPTTPFQQMLDAMETARKTTPWVPEPVPEPARARKRGRPHLDPAPIFDAPLPRQTRSMRQPAEPSPERRLRGRLRGSGTG